MATDPAVSAPPGRALPERAAGAVLAAGWVALTFLTAGTWRWPSGWVYLAALAAGLSAHRAHVAARNPALFARRSQVGEGTKAWDLLWLGLFWPLMLAVPAVAGLDTVRLAHAPLPAWCWAAGAALLAPGLALSARAMAANPFFEGTSRIQPGQQVVDAGPYATIRHPGYAGLALWALASPLLLRSALALLPALAATAWVAVRTALEDRMLQRELSGYPAYARRVRWRLVPHVW